MRVCAALGLSSLLSLPGHAQITLDGSLGPGRPLAGPAFGIPATVGEQVGGNLFHSFGVFNINTSESATFTGPGGIQNVIGRVTGGSESTINGALNSTIPDADVYLINPAGVMFGENAQVNVPGSFHVSTADYIRLGANGRFAAATQSSASTLTVAPPAAFGFLDNRVAPISMIGSNLEVDAGETFSSIGGNVSIAGGSVVAPRGRINIASVASPGEIKVAGGSLNVDSFARLGNIKISRGALVDTSGEGGGSIFLRGGHLRLNNAFLDARAMGARNGNGINIILTGDLIGSSGARIRTITSGAGRAETS